MIRIGRTNGAARQSSPDAAFDPFFSFEDRPFKIGAGKQIAMYRRIYSKRKHGAFCIEILQRFRTIGAVRYLHSPTSTFFLRASVATMLISWSLCHQRPIEEAKKGNCPSKFLRTRYSLQHASKESKANSETNGATACFHTVAAAEAVRISVLCEAINRNQNLRNRSEIL